VVQDLRLSNNSAERSRSHQNFGIVYCHVVHDAWLYQKDPFEIKIKIPKEIVEKSFVLPSAPERDNKYDTDTE
jgi:hypothetical protein